MYEMYPETWRLDGDAVGRNTEVGQRRRTRRNVPRLARERRDLAGESPRPAPVPAGVVEPS